MSMLSKGREAMGRVLMRNVWKLPPEELLAMYNRYMLTSRNHLVKYIFAFYGVSLQ